MQQNSLAMIRCPRGKIKNAFAWKAFPLRLVQGKVKRMLTCHLEVRWLLPGKNPKPR